MAGPGKPTSLGVFDRPQTDGITGIEIAAFVLSTIWLVGAGVFVLTGTGLDGMRFAVTLLAVFLPVAMIWVAATAARSARVMREESARLQAAIDSMRQTYVSEYQHRDLRIAGEGTPEDQALATFQSARARGQAGHPGALPDDTDTPQTQPAPDTAQEKTSARTTQAQAEAVAAVEDQASLALGAEEDAVELPNALIIRALNFPQTAEDEEGFEALRWAMQDRGLAQLITAAQDILTLLSQDGIYMDDLIPDRARPEIWRHFADGARGRPIAPLGGIRDRSSLALSAARMREDAIFRDTAHHFLRRFDKYFAVFAAQADDAEISRLAETRTARAFMLLGRIAGTFA